MNWNDHSKLKGQHAFLSPSKYYWLNYDLDKLAETYRNFQAIQRGTKLHELASGLIEERIRQARNHNTFNEFVNDAIGYGMRSEQGLYFSRNCFGTTDAICFKNNILRVHDLKTGMTPAHMEQLLIYAALFCLEYKIDPEDIKTFLRIYQNNDVDEACPEGESIREVMDIIVESDACIEEIKTEE